MKKTVKNNRQKKKKDGALKSMSGEWLYMAPQKISLRQIGELLGQEKNADIELWEDAGVLELTLPDGNPFDIEMFEISPKDELLEAFVKENRVKEVYAVTFRQESYEYAEQVFGRLIDAAGGFFCGDTDNFEPRFDRI